MSGNDLLVIVPVRGRKENAERLLKSFADTATCADLVFVLDPDDEDTYEDVGWGDALHGVLSPRGTLREKLNQTAEAFAGSYPALMWAEDDYVFTTHAWDAAMLAALEDMGGHGWVHPQTVRRQDVPEIWLASSSLVEATGWFFPPFLNHFYGDNAIAELGKRAGLIRFCPEAVVEHLHYSVRPDVEHDAVYTEAENTYGQADLTAFQQWRADQLPLEASKLRRKFSRDLAWVLGRVA